ADGARVEPVVSFDAIAPEHLPTAAFADPAELLHVHMEQISGPGPLVADDRSRRTVQVGKTIQTMPAQNSIDRRTEPVQLIGQSVGASKRHQTGFDDGR